MHPSKRTANATNTIFNKKHAAVAFNNILKFRKNPDICTKVRVWVGGQIGGRT